MGRQGKGRVITLACESPMNGLHPDGSIASFTWTFWDGQTGTGQKPDHVHPTAGTFTVTLTVPENEGASDSLVRANLITMSNPSPGQYTLGIQVTGQGIVAMNPTGGSYAPGTSVRLTATPDSGWELSGWSGDLTGSANPATITMDANKTVAATFTETSNDDPAGSGGSGGGGGDVLSTMRHTGGGWSPTRHGKLNRESVNFGPHYARTTWCDRGYSCPPGRSHKVRGRSPRIPLFGRQSASAPQGYYGSRN
jgi:hypothetical protein